MHYLLESIKSSKKDIIVSLIFSITGAVLSLGLPVLVGNAVGNIGNGKNIEQLWRLTLLPCLVLFLMGVVNAFLHYYLARVGQNIIYDIRSSLMQKLMLINISVYDRKVKGDFLSTVMNATNEIKYLISQGVVAGVGGTVTLVGAIVGMYAIDRLLLLVSMLIILVFVILSIMLSSLISKKSFSYQESLSDLTSGLDRAITAIRTIRANNYSEMELDKLLKYADLVRRSSIYLAKLHAILEPLALLAFQTVIISILSIGGYRVLIGIMDFSDLISFLLYVFIIIVPSAQLFSAFGSFGEAQGAMARISEIFDLEDENISDSTIVRSRVVDSSINIKNVSFNYGKAGAALKNVNLEIKEGEMVGIAGPTGSGKSTVLKLIINFYDPDTGKVNIGKVDISTLPKTISRKGIAYVEQDSPVLHGTVLDNLFIANNNATLEDCTEALVAVGLWDKFNDKHGGLNHFIGETGVTLSGGERQRLALARALVSKPKILLLDEVTSNLDSMSESCIIEYIRNFKKNTTIVIVAHRLSTLVDCDAIYVMEHGQIVSHGTHKELLDQPGVYRNMALNQKLID